MNHDDDSEPSTTFQDRLLDVVEGRRSIDDREIRAAMAADPRFAAHVQGALDVTGALARLRAAEAEALAAPAGPLDAVAVAAARAGLGLPPRAALVGARRWPRFVLALAASLVLGAVLWNAIGQPKAPEVPTHLGGTPAVAVTFAGGDLVLAPPLQDGQHYEIEFLVGGKKVDQTTVRRTDRLPLPDLSRYGAGVQVRARWMQGDQELAPSVTVSLPPRTGR